MRTLGRVLFVMLASLFVTAGQRNDDWIRYESLEGRYSVSMPREPKASSRYATTSTGEKLPQYSAASIDGSAGFIVGYFDYTSQMSFSFNEARDAMLSSMNATSLADETTSLGDAPGRALRFLAKANGFEFVDRARFYDISRRIYVLQCIFPKTEDGATVNEKCDKFFDSFKVSQP